MNQIIYLYITILSIIEMVFCFTNSTEPLTQDDVKRLYSNKLIECNTDKDCPNEYDLCDNFSGIKHFCKVSYNCHEDRCYQNIFKTWLCNSIDDCLNTPDKCEVDDDNKNQCNIKRICNGDKDDDCFIPDCYVDADCVSGTCKNNYCETKKVQYTCENMEDATVKCKKNVGEKCEKDDECFEDNCYDGECHPPSQFDFTPLIIIICSVVVACILLCACTCYICKKRRHN